MAKTSSMESYDGKPLNSFRNLDTAYFKEDENSFLPLQVSLKHQQTLETEVEQFELELPLTSETTRFGNESLPVFQYRKEIVDAVKKNPFTIVVAETGAGKSTQVPQFLLDAGWDTIYLTQPRRAAARNVYQRIRDEVGSVVGDYEAGSSVSYQTAVERDGPDNARIKVVTDGLQLVRELHDSGIIENDVLIIDEVHEWNTNIEVLVAWAKKIIAEKPQLRVVIMSATIEAERLALYLSEVCEKVPPIIEIPGRNYNVEFSEKPYSTVVNETLRAIRVIAEMQLDDEDLANGILVFEPGKREIQDAIDEISRRLPGDLANKVTILPLHSKQTVADQQLAFDKYKGIKIVVATDVAQTSLTIPDILYVIDSGMRRSVELDEEDAQGLVLHPKSQADCDQSAGRTGRVGDGFYILTKPSEESIYIPYINRDKFPTAEILRTDIVRNTLLVAGVDLNIALLDLYHQVDLKTIERSQDRLRTLGALDGDNSITNLGIRMNQYPLNVASARMMVEVSNFNKNTQSYMSAIVASKEVGGLQYFAYNVGKRWKELTKETTSDLLTQLDIYIAIQDMTESEMREYDLDIHNVIRSREQYRKIAKRIDAIQETLITPSLEERENIKQCIYAGLVTSMYKSVGSKSYVRLDNDNTAREISNRSVIRSEPKYLVGDAYRVEHYSDGELVKKHIIEHVTSATLADLGKAAIHLCNWKSEGYAMRNGRFVNIKRLSLFGNEFGNTEEEVAIPSLALREMIISHVLEKPGSQQRMLRKIKKALTHLNHLSKDKISQLTDESILALIDEATPADVTDPTIVDDNLRKIIETRGISLDLYADEHTRKRIIDDAPENITVDGVNLNLTYRNHIPLVKNYNQIEILNIKDDVFLNDGRSVLFLEDKKPRTLLQIQHKLESNLI